ncbi:MAG TPA: phosphohistidine phosphatase SixA, partial [Chloroflexota bacterium]|nr:phosphohistidine phosphatase SixA [Chloroflexota bacterium]
MNLYLVRHAIAFQPDPASWPDDRDRPLTPQGEKKFRRAVRGLEALVPGVDVVLSSPLVRAWRTAEILRKTAGWPEPSRFDPLEPGTAPADVVDALQPHASAESVALVGHEPSLHELLSYLLSGDPGNVKVTMKKGGVAYLSVDDGLRAGSAAL